MSSDPFPEHLDAVRLFARNGSIVASLPLGRLPRFTEHLLDSEGQVAVALHFGHDEEERQHLSGTLRVEVRLRCQRCMEPLPLALECELDLLVFDSEAELQALPDEEDALDALVVDSERGLDVLAVIEDELLLSLPLVPMHPASDCSETLNAYQRKQEESQERSNPFAVLASLKRENDSH
ncbi:MAG TPA: YceD family protein [Hyphomicrobiales bacterium]|nr:YceD family protein [Hyphomicrobiales bacterium]